MDGWVGWDGWMGWKGKGRGLRGGVLIDIINYHGCVSRKPGGRRREGRGGFGKGEGIDR